MLADRVWKRRSDRFAISVTHNAPYATSARAVFSTLSPWARVVLRPALSQPPVESRATLQFNDNGNNTPQSVRLLGTAT